MHRLIPPEKRAGCTCHNCGETRSVKYEVDLLDGKGNSMGEATLCNKCFLEFLSMEERMKKWNLG